MKTGTVSIPNILESSNRIDPSFFLSDGVKYRRVLHDSQIPLCQLSECADKVFMGNIFSRNFVGADFDGVPYLSASDTVLRDLNTRVFLSKEQSSKLSYLMLDKDWILITCSGTIGNVTLTNEDYCGHIATHDLIRVIPNDHLIAKGVLYAFLASKYGKYQLTQSRFGGVVKHINCDQVKCIQVPVFSSIDQNEINCKVLKASSLRHEATLLLKEAEQLLYSSIGLSTLKSDSYDYYGPRDSKRGTSTFTKSIKDIGTTSINAFNHSERIYKLRQKLPDSCVHLRNVLANGTTFSTGQVSSIEVPPEKGIMFINQSDIFNNKIEGKYISRNKVASKSLVKYGEVLIACDGTLGESELFCRAIYAGEELDGALVSSHFLRMNTIDSIPSGYLYIWLNSDYGFRLIRNTQAGTKLCHPIPALFLDIPIPIPDVSVMKTIDDLVKIAHTQRYQARQIEQEAIQRIESLIDLHASIQK